MKKRTVPKLCIGFFLALRNFGIDWFIILVDHFLENKNIQQCWDQTRCRGGICLDEICWSWSQFELVPCKSIMQKVPPLLMHPGRGILQKIFLTKVTQYGSPLLLILVVRRVRCQLWASLASEVQLVSYFLSVCSGGVYCSRHRPAEPRRLAFQWAPVLMFTFSRLHCLLKKACFLFGLRWSRLPSGFTGGGLSCSTTSRGFGPRRMVLYGN